MVCLLYDVSLELEIICFFHITGSRQKVANPVLAGDIGIAQQAARTNTRGGIDNSDAISQHSEAYVGKRSTMRPRQMSA